jgi:hypothetical protein
MTNEPCINWPCAKGAGHAGPCGTSRDEQPVQPSSNELLSQAWDDIDSLMEYAFDNGFHELGYDPARVISDEMERVAQELADLKAAGSSAPEPCAVCDGVGGGVTRDGIESECSKCKGTGAGQPPGVWQPIASAPIESDTPILMTDGQWYAAGYVGRDDFHKYRISHFAVSQEYDWEPTHWMPLFWWR